MFTWFVRHLLGLSDMEARRFICGAITDHDFEWIGPDYFRCRACGQVGDVYDLIY